MPDVASRRQPGRSLEARGVEPLFPMPSYRFQHFVEAGVSLHYWALMIWDSILITIQFRDPACGCQQCVPQLGVTGGDAAIRRKYGQFAVAAQMGNCAVIT